MDSELNHLLDQITPAPVPSADELRAIVTRARSRYRRMVSIAIVLAMAGGLTVVVAGSRAAPNARTVTRPFGPAALAVAVSGASAPTSSAQRPPITFRPLFFRTTTDKVTIRAHLGTITGPLPCPPDQDCPAPSRLPHTLLHVGLSTDAVVGEMAVPADGPAPPILALVAPSGFGLPGVASGFALVFRAGAQVARVRMIFADGGSDEMAPVEGWAVASHVGRSPFGTVEALDAKGRVLGSSSIPPAPPSSSSPGDTRGSANGVPEPGRSS